MRETKSVAWLDSHTYSCMHVLMIHVSAYLCVWCVCVRVCVCVVCACAHVCVCVGIDGCLVVGRYVAVWVCECLQINE